MNKLVIAVLLGAAPATAYAQAADTPAAEPKSKIITVVRADVAPPQSEAPHTIGAIRARSARVGERTVSLVDGTLPEGRVTAAGSSGS